MLTEQEVNTLVVKCVIIVTNDTRAQGRQACRDYTMLLKAPFSNAYKAGFSCSRSRDLQHHFYSYFCTLDRDCIDASITLTFRECICKVLFIDLAMNMTLHMFMMKNTTHHFQHRFQCVRNESLTYIKEMVSEHGNFSFHVFKSK